jgi:hypothetical protein
MRMRWALFLLFCFLPLQSCGGRPNIPVNAGLRCNCAPTQDLVDKIVEIAIKNNFLKIDYPLHEDPYTTVIVSLNHSKLKNLTMSLLTFNGKFHVIVTEEMSSGPFDYEYFSVVEKFETDVIREMPNIFEECHRDFYSKKTVCALNGSVSKF